MSYPARRLRGMLDLVLPLSCGGCGAVSTRWCEVCAQAFAAEPVLIVPREDPGVPVFSLGRYAGSRREAIVAMKERGRRDLVGQLGGAFGRGLGQLLRWRLVDPPVILVPAPTRWSSARGRGGDPVTAIARTAARQTAAAGVAPILRMRFGVRDSVGLSAADRRRNVAGRIRARQTAIPDGELILVDDVVTTGATAAESVRVLRETGRTVAAVLALTHA